MKDDCEKPRYLLYLFEIDPNDYKTVTIWSWVMSVICIFMAIFCGYSLVLIMRKKT